MKKFGKKLLAILTAGVIMVAGAVTVFAEGSTQPVETDGGYIDRELKDAPAYATLDAATKELVDAINAGTKTIQDIPGINLSGKQAVTNVKDIDKWGDESKLAKSADGKYQPTIVVAALTTSMTGVQIAHYSQVRNVWELITPSKVDLNAKTITFELEDISPFIVVCDKTASGGTSPDTGVSSTAAVWGITAAVLFAAAMVFVVRRRKVN